MNCYYHPSIEATETCVSCGKAVCHTCAVEVSGRVTCQNCLANGRSSVSQPSKPTNSLAVVSVILGVLGICMPGLIFSIPAWVLGNMAIKQIKDTPNQEGLQLANAGRILGMVITILTSALLLLYLVFVFGTIFLAALSAVFQQ